MENLSPHYLEEADWLFRKMVRKFVKERDKITIEGITLPGLMILNKVIHEGEQRLGDLAEELDFTSGAITALCDKLEERDFAVRRRVPEDRRTVLLDITDQGREMYARNQNIGHRCISIMFDGISEEALIAQSGLFRQIINNLEQFSGKILELAKANGEQANAPLMQEEASEQSKPTKTKENPYYLSY